MRSKSITKASVTHAHDSGVPTDKKVKTADLLRVEIIV